MADISKIKLTGGQEYNIKDEVARASITDIESEIGDIATALDEINR